MKLKGLISAGALALAMTGGASAAHAGNLFVGGDFSTGNLGIWSKFVTLHGTLGEDPNPYVTSFDVTGGGAQNAASFDVGETIDVGQQQGGGIAQLITTTAGVLNFSASIAAYAPNHANDDAGTFAVLLDGTVLDSDAFGGIDLGQVMRGSLTFSTPVTAGKHQVNIEITRHYLTCGYFCTPNEYVTNISASMAVVPEPETWTIMLIGFGALGMLMRSKRQGLGRVAAAT
jgi:hypothetical protein